MDLSENQWRAVVPLLPAEEIRKEGRGRPWRDPRDVLNAVLWVLRTGAPWADLPQRYPPYQTCHRRFQQWVEGGLFPKILRALAADLEKRGKLKLDEAFIDGTWAGAKKKARAWEKLAVEVRPRSWQSQMLLVFLSPYQSRMELETK
jgi:transposase